MPEEKSIEVNDLNVAQMLGLSEEAFKQTSPDEIYSQIETSHKQRQLEYENAQGRVNKRLAKKRLEEVIHKKECVQAWQKNSELEAILESILELADAGSFFRASELLDASEHKFHDQVGTPLKMRFQRVQEMIQETLKPPAKEETQSEHSRNAISKPKEQDQPSAPNIDKPPLVAKEPDPVVIPQSAPAKTNLKEAKPSPPPCERMTLDLGKAGRLHVVNGSGSLTFGRYKNPNSPDYELIAAIPQDKSETSRLMRMISGRHGSIIHSNGQWGIIDSWPGQECISTNGIFIEKAKLESPVSFRRLDGKRLSFATSDPDVPLPAFRIHVLHSGEITASESILLERLDAFQDHILLLSEKTVLPKEFGGLTLCSIDGGLALGVEKAPLTAQSEQVLSFGKVELTPLETIFYGREM